MGGQKWSKSCPRGCWMPPSLPCLPGFPGLPGLPSLPGLPGLLGLPCLPGLPGISVLSPNIVYDNPVACRVGYLGAYHVDIPYIAELNTSESAVWYLKKEQLYQGSVPGVYKGPLSLFMSKFLDGRDWMEIIVTLNYITTKCFKNGPPVEDMESHPFVSYLTLPDTTLYYTYFANASKSLEVSGPKITSKPSMETFKTLGDYINDHMDDKGWVKLISNTKYLVKVCRQKVNDFTHFSWPYHAGLTTNPIMAHELLQIIIKYLGTGFQSPYCYNECVLPPTFD